MCVFTIIFIYIYAILNIKQRNNNFFLYLELNNKYKSAFNYLQKNLCHKSRNILVFIMQVNDYI